MQTSKSSAVPTLEFVRSIHEDLRRSLNASGAWFELTAHEPQGAFAKWFLENDALFDPECKRAFETFCDDHQIQGEPLTEEVALRFIVHQQGCQVATVSLPSDDPSCATVYRTVAGFARASGLCVHDPQAGRDVDLESPGDYPILWK